MRCIALTLLIPLALAAQPVAVGRGGVGAAPPTGAGVGAPNALPQPPPTPTADLATADGQVTNAIGGTPLRKATITLNRVNNGPNTVGRGNYSATTDANGHYTINGIEPGTYRLNARRTGFLGMQYNARRPDGPGTSIDFGRAEKKAGVDFKLTPQGVVTGKITDEDDDPVENVQVQLMRVVYVQGKPQLQQNNGASTNDLGEFRISGIDPGKIYLAATYRGPRMMGLPQDLAANATQEDYVTTFYPGVTDLSAASPLELGPGDQAQGVNIRLKKTVTVHVSGRAIGSATPAPAPEPPGGGRGGIATQVNGPDGIINFSPMGNPRIQVRLEPRNAMNPMGLMQNSVTKPDGTFDFPSVAPGPYYLMAIDNQGAGRGPHVAKQSVDVGNASLEGLTIAIQPGGNVTGHVRYDGDPPATPPSLTVRLTPHEQNIGLPMPQPAKVGPDGSFEFTDVNLDSYDVNLNTPPCNQSTNPPQCYYVKSVRSGSTDVLTAGLDLTSGAGSLDVLIGLNPPQVTGSVVNPATDQPATAVTVVLMPREKERQNRGYFYQTTNSDQYGNFTFTRVTPGDYEVYAWEDVQYGQWFDPEWMKVNGGKGETVTAQEGTPANVKLTMIPAK